MTIIERDGQSRYEVEKINGYTLDRGYEESCRTYAQGFINDKSGTMVVLDDPIFLMYDGVVNDFGQVFEACQKMYAAMVAVNRPNKSVVLVAHAFSDMALGDFHVNWNFEKSVLKIFPLASPEKSIMNWRTQILMDLQAYTGTPLFNPVDRPIIDLVPEAIIASSRVKRFECSRFKAMIFAKEDPDAIQIRVDELKEQQKAPESDYELNDINVRIGKLTSGIVRFNIYGPSAGETREKRDRAEDAWMAIKGAIKSGAVPGGGYVLIRLAATLQASSGLMPHGPRRLAAEILGTAFLEPVRLLYYNYGYTKEDTEKQISELLRRDSEDIRYTVMRSGFRSWNCSIHCPPCQKPCEIVFQLPRFLVPSVVL